MPPRAFATLCGMEESNVKETQAEKIARIKRGLDAVPTLPGVYLWKDKDGQVIYVGKAKQLRARMRQYVNFQDDRAKIPLLVDQIDSFEYIVVGNEHESLVLEKNLINQYAPFFNADFKDDKSYPFIALTKGDVFPAIKYTREKHKPDTRYFGPYTDSRAARRMVDIARRVVPLCATSCADWRNLSRRLENDPLAMMKSDVRPCFDCHVGLGPGACCGRITPEEYAVNVRRIERFLAGQHREFLDELSAEMADAAADLDFERAARIKARIDTINSLTDKQHAVSAHNLNADVVGLFREETIAGAHVLVIREGRIINSNEFVLNRGRDVPDQDLLHNFLLRYYDTTTSIPHEVIVRELPEDEESMETWLTEKLASAHGAKVRFSAPQKGEKAALVDMAETNAKHTLMRYKVRTNYEDKRVNDALLQLESALALDAPRASAEPWPDDMMPVYNDGPTHPAICTNVVISATPNGFWSGGSTRSPAVCDGEKMNPTAAYMSRAAANTTGTDSVGLTTANAKKPTAMPANPSGSSGHSPRRSMIRPPISVAPAFASTGTNITSPAESAVMPAAPSKYSGSSTLMENVLIIATVANSKAGQNRRFLMGARSMSG